MDFVDIHWFSYLFLNEVFPPPEFLISRSSLLKKCVSEEFPKAIKK